MKGLIRLMFQVFSNVCIFCWFTTDHKKHSLVGLGFFLMQLCPQQVWATFFKVTPCLKKCLISNQSFCIKPASENSSDTCIKKFWWIYKKQYQTIVELNSVRGAVPSHSFAAAILILSERVQRDKYFECGKCIMLWCIFSGTRQKAISI